MLNKVEKHQILIIMKQLQ